MQKDFDIILFDLGGVLVELGPEPLPASLLPAGKQFLLDQWFASETAHAFEKGQVSSARFAAALVDELGLDCSVEQVIEHFTRWPQGLFDGIGDLLARLRRDYRLAVLTNTNELHWPRFFEEFGLHEHVDQFFASHLLAMAKPESEIFAHVIDSLNAAPQRILFFDDNPANVESARACGMQASRVQGLDPLLAALHEWGVLVD